MRFARVFAIACIFTGYALSNVQIAHAQTSAKEISIGPEKAHTLIEEGARVIDVRSPEEFDTGHLEGAINIPHDQIEGRLDELGGTPKDVLVLYCKSGRRSQMAAEALFERGYKKVYNAGGYSDLTK